MFVYICYICVTIGTCSVHFKITHNINKGTIYMWNIYESPELDSQYPQQQAIKGRKISLWI